MKLKTISMHVSAISFGAFFAVFFGGALSGCVTGVQSVDIELASTGEAVPSPVFVASADSGQVRFSDVKVYEQQSGCLIPECPVVWHVVLPDEGTLNSLAYGYLPSFGSQTMVSPRTLEAGKEYELVVGTATAEAPDARGRMGFYVNKNGKVLPLGVTE